ncbi:MAG TPA: hypothetical protein VK645_18570 [Chitinophagaceae bacterium]|nr:hypothetical protein [Chitinophagaceae bacterium]
MKKYFNIIVVTLLLAVTVSGCKKSESVQPKNYTLSIKDKTWWGELAYTGKTPEYYSVHFNADNTLAWSQFQGDYTGHWTLNNKQVTITFDGNSTQIKADISDDDNLVNITDNSTASEIKGGEMAANSTIALDNSVWTGNTQVPTKALQLNFKTGLQATINLENTPVKTYTYTKYSSNSVIRISTIFFGIVISGSKMKGSIDNSVFTWQATKQ